MHAVYSAYYGTYCTMAGPVDGGSPQAREVESGEGTALVIFTAATLSAAAVLMFTTVVCTVLASFKKKAWPSPLSKEFAFSCIFFMMVFRC
jgi:hypothetical protein